MTNVTPIRAQQASEDRFIADIMPVDYPVGVRFVSVPQYTASEMRFAFFIGGYVGAMVTVALAFCWSWWLA